MTKREICERLMSIHNSVMFASNGSGDIGGGPSYGVGKALRDLLLDLAAPEEEKPEEEKPSARICNGKFAYTGCNCGGKAYVKMRIHEGEAFVAKCAKCGNVMQGVPDWRIDWTNDPPPENLFAEEKCPPVVTYNDIDEKRPCPQCGQFCPADLVSGRYFCRTHGSFKHKEDK